MESRAKLLGHPIHQMLIVFPLGLLAMALIFDVLYAASWWLRRASPDNPMTIAYVASFGGGLIALVTGWLGGELVDRLSVGVDPGAHVDAPSSLKSRRAA